MDNLTKVLNKILISKDLPEVSSYEEITNVEKPEILMTLMEGLKDEENMSQISKALEIDVKNIFEQIATAQQNLAAINNKIKQEGNGSKSSLDKIQGNIERTFILEFEMLNGIFEITKSFAELFYEYQASEETIIRILSLKEAITQVKEIIDDNFNLLLQVSGEKIH